MDRERLDALARLLAAAGSRRAALGAVLGAALWGPSPSAGAKKGKRRKHKKHKKPQSCVTTLVCENPGDGQILTGCNLAATELAACDGCILREVDLRVADLSGGSFQGASFREANLHGASLEDANVSGADFRGACLVDASFLGANVDGAQFRDAVLCNTTLANGVVDDSGCHRGTACCPTLCESEGCPDGGGQCQYTGYPCGGLGLQCCPGLVCKGFPFFVCDPPS